MLNRDDEITLEYSGKMTMGEILDKLRGSGVKRKQNIKDVMQILGPMIGDKLRTYITDSVALNAFHLGMMFATKYPDKATALGVDISEHLIELGETLGATRENFYDRCDKLMERIKNA